MASRSILVLGGARSGKSAFAQSMAQDMARAAGGRPGIIATAQAFDEEMTQRIDQHKADRGDAWLCTEEPLNLAAEINGFAPQCAALLIDCLTLWLSNIMHAERDLAAQTAGLVEALTDSPCPVIMVSNEVGLGIVPETPLGRAFRDTQGRLNQDLAQVCDQVTFLAAGLPLHLKGPPTS